MAAVATVIATAAPIIAVVAKFLKKGGETEEPGENLDDIKPAPGEEINTDTAAGDPETPEAAAKQPTESGSNTTETRGESGFKFTPTTGLIIGAVVIGGFLLMKKKK